MEVGLIGQLGLNALKVVVVELNPIQEPVKILNHLVEVQLVSELQKRQDCVILIHVQSVTVHFEFAEIPLNRLVLINVIFY